VCRPENATKFLVEFYRWFPSMHSRRIADLEPCGFMVWHTDERIADVECATYYLAHKLLGRCGWQALAPSATDLLVHWWLRSRKQVPKARRNSFDSLVVLIFWSLWLKTNSRVFRGVDAADLRNHPCKRRALVQRQKLGHVQLL
jgi:hypothetical protein